MLSEKEKMLKGEWFQDNEPWMVKQRALAGNTSTIYNQTMVEEKEKRDKLLKELLGSFGKNSFIANGVQFDYGCNIYIGDDVYINFNVVFLDGNEIHIGNRCLIGPGVLFATPSHPLVAQERSKHFNEYGAYFPEKVKKIVLEEDVWIGGNATIMPGVTIGRGAVIGGGSVVTRDIPANSLAVGNPCKVIRQITDKDRVGIL